MQKGIVMQVQLYITGDDAPAHDFSQTGHDIALQVLQQGLQHFSGPYAIQVQKVQPVEGGDDDSDEPASGDALDIQPLLSYTPASSSPSSTAASSSTPQAASSSESSASVPPQSTQSTPPHAQAAQPPQSEPEKPKEPPKHHFWDR
jgi:hypothetical protein